MGSDKATLPFGPEVLLQRVVQLVGEVVDPRAMVIVASRDQVLPPLPDAVQMVRDDSEYPGPLAALATGLRALGNRADAVFATGCDLPLLVPALVEQLFALLDGYDAVVPWDGNRDHPLAAVYRPQLAGEIEKLLTAGHFSMRALVTAIRTHRIHAEDLREIDPELRSLRNLNTEQEYAAALRLAGFAHT